MTMFNLTLIKVKFYVTHVWIVLMTVTTFEMPNCPDKLIEVRTRTHFYTNLTFEPRSQLISQIDYSYKVSHWLSILWECLCCTDKLLQLISMSLVKRQVSESLDVCVTIDACTAGRRRTFHRRRSVHSFLNSS